MPQTNLEILTPGVGASSLHCVGGKSLASGANYFMGKEILPQENEIEVWVDISGYEGYYQVSSFGQVRSLDRYVKSCNGKFKLMKGKVMAVVKCPRSGYNILGLWKDAVRKTKRKYRLVCYAFHQNPENKTDVNHIDGVKTNDYYKNLEWNTPKENQEHAVRIGLFSYAMKVYALNTETLKIELYPSQKNAGRALGMSNQTIAKRIDKDMEFRGFKFYSAMTTELEAQIESLKQGMRGIYE